MDKIDGFELGTRLHSSAMGSIYEVKSGAPFPSVIKLPHMKRGDPLANLIAFEVESMLLPALRGSHLPRFVASGGIDRQPYLVMERIHGESLQSRIDRGRVGQGEAATIAAAIADALHELHSQDAIHCDLKPDNVLLRPDGSVALIDFGLAHHARFPDLLTEESRFAAGSAPYVSPEQVRGVRSDPRSDLFSLGVVLYEMLTAKLPFGTPQSMAGLRDRLWREPVPPSLLVTGVEPWMQEIVLHCLEVDADSRYQSAAHIAFDLRNPAQVQLTERARRSGAPGTFAQLQRWWRSRDTRRNTLRPAGMTNAAPVILAAVDTVHPEDERHPAIRSTIAQVLRLSRDFRLICLAVVPGGPSGERDALDHMARLRQWVEPFNLNNERLSLHVVESPSPAQSIVEFAERNHAALIVLGAPQPDKQALAWWRSVASAVTANAPCSVHVVRLSQS
jgi:serine/threonine protein kinase